MHFVFGVLIALRRNLSPDFDENNEEALTAIARQLGDMVDFVGGAEHVPVVLPLLEKLASSEETLIREAAVESFSKLIPKLVADDVVNKLLPLVKRTFIEGVGLVFCLAVLA